VARRPAITDACGEEPGGVCEAVWDATENEHLARLADWFIGRPLSILTILLVAWLLSRFARRGLRRFVQRAVVADVAAGRALSRIGVPAPGLVVADPRREARARSISTVLASTVTVLIWVVALILVLGELGINLAPLIASAGIAGVALGFGAQSLVRDCISGMFMLVEDQFGIGDIVDLGEATGSVERITLRTTVLRSQDGTVWHVPNGEILRVGNMSQQWSVAVVDTVVGPTADVDVAGTLIQETAARVTERDDLRADVLEAPQLLGVESIRPEGTTLRLLVKTRPGRQAILARALREEIQRALVKAGIPLPAPYLAPQYGEPPVP
jgi:small conductance mechanosensitive channel